MEKHLEQRSWDCHNCVRKLQTPTASSSVFVGEKKKNFLSRDHLRVLQWNCNGIRTKKAELEKLLVDHRVDICLIQEAKLKPDERSPLFEGYVTIRKDRGPDPSGDWIRGGGLLTLIKDDVPFTRLADFGGGNSGILENLSVGIAARRGLSLRISNVYCPPIRRIPGENRTVGFEVDLLPTGEKVLMAGDLNAHTKLWDSVQPEDAMGNDLADWMAANDMLPLNDGQITRINPGTGGGSAPDLTIMKSSWKGSTDWKVFNEVGSDHSAILTTVELSLDCVKNEDEQRVNWNWKKARWSEYRALTEVRLANICQEGASLDRWNKEFVSVLIEVANKCIGKTKIPGRRKPWMSEPLRDAIKKRNRLRRNLRDNREEWIAANKEVQEIAKAEKERSWKEFVEEIGAAEDQTKIWRVLKSLSGKTVRSCKNEVLVHQGKALLGSSAKAEAFMSTYAKVSRMKLEKEDRPIKKAASKVTRDQEVAYEEEGPFAISELDTALRSMKAKGAPGDDDIAPRLLQNLGYKGREILLKMLNRSWEEGFCPQAWRDAIIIPLLKSGKPAESIDSYRPVSLTSCIAKVIERMIAARLQYLAERRNWWSDSQAGFRRWRSTEDQVLRLSQDISDGFQERKPLRTVLALLDFSKAYDTVWRSLLISRMESKGVPYRYLMWIRAFLRNRRAKVKWFGEFSKFRCLKQGLPQGAVLSPFLFLFFIDPVSQIISDDVKVSLYADDIAIWCRHSDKMVAAKRVEEAVNIVADWSTRSKLKLNVGKCECSFFSSNCHEAGFVPHVSLSGHRLTFNAEPTFLGITLDRALSFRKQTLKTCNKVAKTCRLLGAITGKEWGCNRRTLRMLFMALVRGNMDYCGAAWQPWISQSSRADLERAQNRAIRIITGQLATTPQDALRAELHIPKYDDVIDYLAGVSLEKAKRLPLTHPRRIAADGSTRHRTSRCNWRRLAFQVSRESGLPATDGSLLIWNMPAPWHLRTKGNWSVNIELDGGSSKEDIKEVVLRDAINTIDRISCDYVVYTDGSAQGGVNDGGSAAVVTEGKACNPQILAIKRKKGPVRTSSFEAEVSALDLALDWLEEEPRGATLICTDSMSLLKSLNSPPMKDEEGVGRVRDRLNRVDGVKLQWVPGHVGLIGNELADKEANLAAGKIQDLGDQPAISFRAAKARLKEDCLRIRTSHARTIEIYGKEGWKPANIVAGRRDQVLLAQLRAGHCANLSAYASIVNPSADPTCKRCRLEPEDVQHWLQRCPALEGKRLEIFGSVAPPLSVLSKNPERVLAFARRSFDRL